MVEAIFQWWIALMMLAGIGHMIESVIYSRKNRALQMGTVWFGLTGFVCLIYSFNLFTGLVGWQLKTVIVLFAPLGIWKTAKFLKVGAFPRWRPKLFDVFVGILVVVVIVLLSNWSIGSAQFGDSSLYHIGLVDYAAKYPVIPGLANLHSRFGFNSTTYLLSAVFQNGIWGIEGFRLANGFICILVLFEVVNRVRKIAHLGFGDISDYVLLIGLSIVIYSAIWIPSTSISAPSPDLPAALLMLIAIVYSAKAFCIGDLENYGLAFCVAMLSFTFRPVTAPLVIFLFALIIHQILTRKRIQMLTVVTLSLSGLLLSMVVTRNIIISGYVFYPSALRVSWLDWAVPKSSAEIDLNAIEAWAKTPAVPYVQVLQSNSWISGWISRWKQHFLLPLISIFLGCLVLVIAMKYNIKALLQNAPIKLFIAIVMLVIFWGYSAPDPRFAVGIIAAVVALPASWGIALLGGRKISKFTAAQLILLFIVSAQFLYIALTPTYPYSTLFRKASPQFDTGFLPFQGAPTKSVVLNSGLVIQVPTDDKGCFRVEMCTVGVNSMTEGLVLRGMKITDGFRIED
jgi:hypothetical protein